MGDINKPGGCPVCSCRDREYLETYEDGNEVGYEYSCTKCSAQYVEWFKLTYTGTTVDSSIYDDDDEDGE